VNEKQYKKIDANNYWLLDKLVTIDRHFIDKLENEFDSKSLSKLRINLHSSYNENLQQMILFLRKDEIIKPHFQDFGNVSYNVIKGHANLNLYYKDQPDKIFQLSTKHSQFMRIPRTVCRSMTVISDIFIFIETCDGPFRKENTNWQLIK